MEHMKVKWNAMYHDLIQAWVIYTDRDIPFRLFIVAGLLPDDGTGELTARAICEEHNKTLK